MKVTDATLLRSNVPETDHPAWAAATTYKKGDRVVVAATHRRYESLIDGNTGKPPAANPIAWVDVGATNRWAAFDAGVGTTTSMPALIDITIQGEGRVNAVAVMDMEATKVRVRVTDKVDGLVYDRTVDLVSASGISDWYAYYFEPILRRRDLVLFDLPPYNDAQVQIEIMNSEGDASVGVVALGQQHELGDTKFGLSLGITDYSVKERDSFGEWRVVQRPYSKKVRAPIRIRAGDVDRVFRLLAQYRAVPLVWVATAIYDASIVYGYYKDVDIVISGPKWSDCSLEIEGLI
jgi:hypothetical protein